MNQAIIENGGIVHTLKAHIVCAECTRFDNFEQDAESTNLELFATAARRYFVQEKNWHCGRPTTLCNECFLGDECERCSGFGRLTLGDNPTSNKRSRKCEDCSGTGRIAKSRGREVAK